MPAPQAQVSSAPAAPVNPTACAQIAPITASILAADPSAVPTVPASVAFNCLKTVPNKPQQAEKLVTSLKAFVEWQSTLAWLKDPPSTYNLPAVDIMGSLDKISSTAVAGGFESEYDFQLAIMNTITAAHDGHFAYSSDVFKAFAFESKLASDIVSVSRDGIEVPKLYHLADLASNATKAPSAITMINGEDAVTMIEELTMKFSAFQDMNSMWNNQFPTYANPSGTLVLAASLAYMGPSLTLTYENGQQKTEENFAIMRSSKADFSAVQTGEDFYNLFCNPEAAAAAASSAAATSTTSPQTATSSVAPSTPEPTIPGFPEPIVRDSGADVTSGYFLQGTGYDDVAVLSVTSFAPTGNVDTLEYLTNFQTTVESFLSQSKQAGKQRLVIDVTANGGGLVVAGFELFAQLFPDAEQFGANNMRLGDSMQNIANIVGSIPASFQPTTQNEALALQALSSSSITSNLVPGGVETPGGAQFQSEQALLGPVTLMGDQFTAYQNAPQDMPASDFNLTGTGSRSSPAPAVFTPDNVVILTDGTCGSTCTLFSYLMLFQLGIKTVAAGGVPRPGPMQSIGGVEGAQVFELPEIANLASAALVLAPADQQEALASTSLGLLSEGYALTRAASASSPGAVNGKNAFSPGNSQTPLQFLNEPANCRVFYTLDMIRDPEATWRRAVDATWADPDTFCVQGSRMPVMAEQTVDPLFRQSVAGTTGASSNNSATTIVGDEAGSGAGGLAPGRSLAAALAAVVSAALMYL
ncbi:peptidase S41 family protein [Xylariaceae sp. FL0016]|nr:peptidase S41 family protein [Xylariaceae sp. FL0016]